MSQRTRIWLLGALIALPFLFVKVLLGQFSFLGSEGRLPPLARFSVEIAPSLLAALFGGGFVAASFANWSRKAKAVLLGAGLIVLFAFPYFAWVYAVKPYLFGITSGLRETRTK